jgi:conjugative transfer ATPase
MSSAGTLKETLLGLPAGVWGSLTGKAVKAASAKVKPEPPEPPNWRKPEQPRATNADQAKLYHHHPGFCDFLPWVEYLPESQCFLLEDNRSVGAVLELTPIGTEGRELDWLLEARDAVENALQDSFDESEDFPWVVQFYCQDDSDFSPYMRSLREYVKNAASGSDFTKHFLDLTSHHMRAIAKPGGLFHDNRVTKQPWRGQNRRVRMVVYRRLNFRAKLDQTPEQELNNACDRIAGSLRGAGVESRRVDGRDFYEWLLPWFNPKPQLAGDKNPIDFYPKVPYWGAEKEVESLPLPFSHDFSERIFFSEPRSNVEKGFWYFDEMPHSLIVVDKLRRAPKIGHTTGETAKGDSLSAMFDRVPEDTIMVLTMVVRPQDILEAHLNRLSKKAIGENIASAQTREDVEKARSILGRSHKLYRATLAFFIRGRNDAELHERHVALANVLLSEDLIPVQEGEEIAGCNSYLRWLPMCYNPLDDRKEWYTSFLFAQHIANITPVWGRNIGTGRPCLSFFNRGGAPVTLDPLSQRDRAMNAHMLIFGPTGAGKSASLVTIMSQVMGIYRPRLFIVEAGNSFGLLGQFFSKLGLSVNQISIKPGVHITLAPYADARLLIESADKIEKPIVEEEILQKVEEAETLKKFQVDEKKAAESDDFDEKRDVLGELEIIARLMITGGESKEEDRLTRADRAVIRRCIIDAARVCVNDGRTVLTRDIIEALNRAAHDPDLKEGRATRIIEMAEAMEMYTQGFDGQMFDREGTTWPESDVTIVDLGHYAREGNEAQMSIAYISLMNTVNNIAERDQYKGRPIIMATDEGHIITKNPLVAPYAVKITKMWRKLGAWFWLATQNMADLPGTAETLLNMIEWWICLVMPHGEIDSIARFKKLTTAQKALLLSASKEPQKFTEGVVLSKNHEFLFRSVPPSLFLALAMTEPEEKLERAEIMREKHCSELEAAFWVAEKLDRARGIEPMPWRHLFEKETEAA